MTPRSSHQGPRLPVVRARVREEDNRGEVYVWLARAGSSNAALMMANPRHAVLDNTPCSRHGWAPRWVLSVAGSSTSRKVGEMLQLPAAWGES